MASFVATKVFFVFTSNYVLHHETKKRQKRVSDDIRQEDYKSDLILFNTSSSTANELNIWSRDIQQGDTKNACSLLQQNSKLTGLSVANVF